MPKNKNKPYERPDFDSMADEQLWAYTDAKIAERRAKMQESGNWEPEEIERRMALQREGIFCRARKISPCCKAPYDLSCVQKSGRFAGHGHYLCSKCKQSLFQV